MNIINVVTIDMIPEIDFSIQINKSNLSLHNNMNSERSHPDIYNLSC